MRSLAALVLLVSAWSANAAEFRSIAENGTPMYDAPSVRAKKLFVASRQYPVEVVISIDSWVKVRDQAGDLVWVEKKTLSEKRTVIVTVPVADVKQAANDQAPLVFQAQQGVALDVAELPAGGWVRVRHAEGQSGYVKINQVWGI
jgi:SH3-like domain-containing protein